jgi:hypothetical protein
VTNRGPNAATGVTLADMLPAEVEVVSILPTQGRCTNDNGVVYCDLGDLLPQARAMVAVVVRPATTGGINNGVTVAANEADLVPGNNTSTVTTTVLIDTGIFSNHDVIPIPESGPAGLYPSTIFVAGVTVRVDNVSVILSNINHTYADDLDVLLVGPGGQGRLSPPGRRDRQRVPRRLLSDFRLAASTLVDQAVAGARLLTDLREGLSRAPGQEYVCAQRVFRGELFGASLDCLHWIRHALGAGDGAADSR